MKTIIISFSLLLISCSSRLQIFTDLDKDFAFSEVTTYSWSEIENIEENNNPLYYNELNDKRIRTEVDQQLARKGYRSVNEKGDLLVHYHIIVRDYTAYREDAALHHNAGWMRTDIRHYEYREGTLLIDFIDSKTSSLVWRGYASAIFNLRIPHTDEQKIRDGIRRILDDFPGISK